MEHKPLRPQKCSEHSSPHPALFCASASIFLQPSMASTCILLSTSPPDHFFQVFFGRPLPLWPCGIHWSGCLDMLSSHLLGVCPSQVHFLRRIWFSTDSCSVSLHNSLLVMMSNGHQVHLLSHCLSPSAADPYCIGCGVSVVDFVYCHYADISQVTIRLFVPFTLSVRLRIGGVPCWICMT